MDCRNIIGTSINPAAEYLYEMGYRLVPELPVLSEGKIVEAINESYGDKSKPFVTHAMNSDRAIAQAQLEDVKRRIGG